MISELLSRHRDQFVAMGLPTHLHQSACQKIISQTFDAGTFFQFEEVSDDSGAFKEHGSASSDDQDVMKEDSIDEGIGYALSTKYALASCSQLTGEGTVILIDHMWTTTFPQSRDHLINIDGLCGRIADMLDLKDDDDSENNNGGCSASFVDRVWRAMWRHVNCYVLPVDDYTRWFLMDEVHLMKSREVCASYWWEVYGLDVSYVMHIHPQGGSALHLTITVHMTCQVGTAITHSADPNVRCCPLLVSLPGHEPFALSLLWPLRDIQEGDVITRNYLPNVPLLDSTRKLRLLAFSGDDSNIMTALNGTHIGINPPISTAISHSESHSSQLLEIEDEWASAVRNIADIAVDAKRTLKVYCDRSDHLSSSLMSNTMRTHADGTHTHRIVLVDTAEEADVLYLIDHTMTAQASSSSSSAAKHEEDQEHSKKGKITSQFCWNGMIVSKEHLVRTMRHAYGTVPFLPVTYDLSYPEQLEGFVADYTARSKRNGGDESGVNSSSNDSGGETVDNIWIMKRYRGRQSMDYPVSDSLPCLLRHLESAPRLASKYVSHPMLYKNRKFDLRYYVIVLSLKPLRILRHKMFVVRVANEIYSNGDLEQYQKHFTVMNFLDDNSNSEDDSVRCIRGTGGKENPTSDQFIDNYNAELFMNKLTDGGDGAMDTSKVDVCRDPVAEDAWSSEVQSGIDSALRLLFSGVALAFQDEPPHPSGSDLHPNAGWSLNQPNVCSARAMYGVDVILTADKKPLVLEVQWAPDCALAVVQNKSFWNEILGGLYLEEFDKFEEL